MDASLALYRRYRPDTYLDVIGQEHVTEPLRQALRNNRVNHAYLFSGPRGCGKTTSARILARCLNCEQGPTPDPCGQCQSCQDLARGGPGSMDVIEIDAASHGGVDDARDLRERAFFAPVSARYKIYIVDEAHMVTTQGFNALLKLVEEPPDHLKFIFATTEPDKVIGTIRSRTHHYPFRLVPPKLLQDYLAELCEAEGVRIDPAALPLVVRAGAGSVRDTLSVLDQLLGAAGENGVDYQHAVSLLGYTPDSLLDDAVQALAEHDGATMFGAVDKVIESGQDPKRFGEDLLRRLRDLVVLSAVPDATQRGLIDGPPEFAEQLAAQAGRFGAAELTRAADVLHEGLTEMRGATAPRLQLELICARMLLPDSTDSQLGLHARLERLESVVRGGAVPQGSPTPAAAPAPAPEPAPAQPPPAPPPTSDALRATEAPRATEPSAPAEAPQPEAPQPSGQEAAADPWAAMPRVGSEQAAGSEQAPAPPAADATPAAQPDSRPAAQPAAGGAGFSEVRQYWEQVLEAVAKRRRFTWIVLSQNGHLVGVDQRTVTVGFVNAGARDSFNSRGGDEIVQQALADVLGGDWRVEAVVDPGGGGASRGGPATPAGGPHASVPGGSNAPGAPGVPSTGGSAGGAPVGAAGGDSPAGTANPNPNGSSGASDQWPEATRVPGAQPSGPELAGSYEPAPADPAPQQQGSPAGASRTAGTEQPSETPNRSAPTAAAVGTGALTGTSTVAVSARQPDHGAPGPGGAYDAGPAQHPSNPDDEVDPETDAAAPGDPLRQVDLLVRELGAQIIEELPNR